MENSQTYIEFIKQLKSTGSKRLDGYNPMTLEKIYDWEREEIEDLIWTNFMEKDVSELAVLMPKLKKYDGISALKTKLEEYRIPSDASVYIAEMLYENTEDEHYIEIIKQNIEKKKDEISYVAQLAHCKPCKSAYDFLADIYIHSDNELIRSTAVTGLLYNKGIIKNPHCIEEFKMNIELERKFIAEEKKERIQNIKMLEAGQFDSHNK